MDEGAVLLLHSNDLSLQLCDHWTKVAGFVNVGNVLQSLILLYGIPPLQKRRFVIIEPIRNEEKLFTDDVCLSVGGEEGLQILYQGCEHAVCQLAQVRLHNIEMCRGEEPSEKVVELVALIDVPVPAERFAAGWMYVGIWVWPGCECSSALGQCVVSQ